MPRISAGLLMFRIHDGEVEVLLAHPGGPFFKNKDDGAWSIPKGEIDEGEDLLDAAQREFEEETGVKPSGPFIPLTPIKQKGGKIVHAWAFKGDCDPAANGQQYIYDGMAATVGKDDGVSRNRPNGILRSHGGESEDQSGAGSVYRRT